MEKCPLFNCRASASLAGGCASHSRNTLGRRSARPTIVSWTLLLCAFGAALSLARPCLAVPFQFEATGNLITARDNHDAILLPNGKVLLAGGEGGQGVGISAELYDPATGTSTPTGNLITERSSHTATLLRNGKVLVAGGLYSVNSGTSAELYDPATGMWTATGNLND